MKATNSVLPVTPQAVWTVTIVQLSAQLQLSAIASMNSIPLEASHRNQPLLQPPLQGQHRPKAVITKSSP